jgi:hypothetical protein
MTLPINAALIKKRAAIAQSIIPRTTAQFSSKNSEY